MGRVALTVVFCSLATLREACFAQTMTWDTLSPPQGIKNVDVECVWEASTCVMHGPGHTPGIRTRCMLPSTAVSALWWPPKRALGPTELGGGTWERNNAHRAVVSNENP